VADGIDIGVRYGMGRYAGLQSEKLLDEEVFPVCSPRLLGQGETQLRPDQLQAMTLIHDTTIDFDPSFPSWRAWLAAHGLAGVDAARGLRFNSTVLSIQAAIDGQGIALGRSVAVAHDVRAGRLVRPFEGAQATRCAYYVLTLPGALTQPHVRAVRDWLFAEAAREG
jgi:LysR family glycine cleavage system transcriptional activator